ncbi:hypothetical protein [Cerasicoccus frondis]|uniref:hypothetical protein n=1 Tax=Cerasicoccus frondis TaxID=490090 RepID=UPI0028529F98|nr:hypothetical protein [Cerasicoccus frondis]
MGKWQIWALIGVLLLALILTYNVVMILLGQAPPFTPWDELQLLAAIAIGYIGRALK